MEASATMATIDLTMSMERGLLMLSLLLMPRLILTSTMEASATTATIDLTMSMERGLLMLSLLLMPTLTPTSWVDTMVDTMAWDTMVDTMDLGDNMDLECQLKRQPAQMTCPSFLTVQFYRSKT